MALELGTRIGLYKVTALLAGGVSATDVRLGNGTVAVGQTKRVLNVHPTGGFDVAPDGRILAAIAVPNAVGTALPPLTLVQNWPALLKK